MKEENKALIDAIAAGDVNRIKALKRRLPYFIVITEDGEYSFSIPYEEGKGNRELRKGKGDWKQSLTPEEKELLDFDYGDDEIRGFDITIVKNEMQNGQQKQPDDLAGKL